MRSIKKKCLEAIEKHGCLLVYPMDNKKEPQSLWSVLYPRKKMLWDWNADGGEEISQLWHTRMEMSVEGKVVYAKWYRGRATFFSREVFKNMLAYLQTSVQTSLDTMQTSDTENRLDVENERPTTKPKLSFQSQEALEVLQMDSPQSTPKLKRAMDLRGRDNESIFNRALKPLWNYLYIVGFGEEEDSSFPSLNMAATEHVFEDLWLESQKISSAKAQTFLLKKLGADNLFYKYAEKLK